MNQKHNHIPEIQHETDNFLSFWVMFCLFKNTRKYHYSITVSQKPWWYDLQFLRYIIWQTEIGNYESFFALLPLPLKNSKYQNFEIMKKKLLETSSFYTCNKNNHIPEIWRETDNFLSFWVKFCSFTSLTTQKIKILKKWKNIWRCHDFTHVYLHSTSNLKN